MAKVTFGIANAAGASSGDFRERREMFINVYRIKTDGLLFAVDSEEAFAELAKGAKDFYLSIMRKSAESPFEIPVPAKVDSKALWIAGAGIAFLLLWPYVSGAHKRPLTAKKT